MAPQRKLIVIVTLAAVAIAAMWFALYRRHVLAPPLASSGGPSLPEIGKEFERASERLRELGERAAAPVNAPATSPASNASDDVVNPVP